MGGRLVLPLQARPAGDPTLVGAKAVGLNLLLRHGFPVPPGFCVLPALTSTLRGLPPDFRRAVAYAYGRLGALVAVRPSATSPAKTILGINGEEAAARAVARCMAAADDLRTGELCPVIMQQLVDAISSGIARGRNPENGDETEILIEAGWGIGQPDPSGNVGPDLFRVRKYPLLLLTSEPAAKVREIRAGPVGLVNRPLPQTLRLAPSLTDAEAVALSDMVRKIEERLGYSVQIEWALTKNGFVLLELDRAPEPPRDSFYLNPTLAGGRSETISVLEATEIPTGVISPLAWDFWSRAGGAALRPLLMRAGLAQAAAKIPPLVLVAGRVYQNTAALGLAIEQATGLAPGSLARLAAAGQKKRPGLIALSRLRPRPLLRLLGLQGALRRLDRERARLAGGEFHDESERLERVLRERLDPVQLAAALDGVDTYLIERLGILLTAGLAADRLRRFQQLLRRYCGSGGESAGARLLAGLGTLATAAPGYALWDLARLIRAASAPPGSRGHENNLRTSLDAFVSEYGHHCAGELDPAVPRWGDDPAAIVSFAADLAFPESILADEHARQQAALRSQAMAWVQGRLSAGWRRILFWRKRRLAKVHAKFLSGYPQLELVKSALGQLLWRYRRLLVLAGRELTEAKILGRADDVFLLRTGEVCAALRGELPAQQAGERIRRRAEAVETYRRLHPPAVITGAYQVSDFDAYPAQLENVALKGLGACPGLGSGPARLIRSTSDLACFVPGEVLVAAKIDAGWGPYLLRARAIVTELGGLMSEAAVLAREYGLPAVVRVDGVLSVLHDGDPLEVDGGTGLVKVARG